MKDLKVIVIIPAFNEEKNLINVVDDLQKYCPEYDYIIINDGSVDNTKTLCKMNGYNCISLISNLGFSGAVQTGYKYAVRNGYDIAVQFDGDGQHSAEYIHKIVEFISAGKGDYIIGSRFVEKRKPVSFRMLGSVLLTLLIKLRTGKKIKDPTSGMRAVTSTIAKKMADNLNFIAEPDTVVQAILSRKKVLEVQVAMNERAHGESHFINPFNGIKYMVRIIISILFYQKVRW